MPGLWEKQEILAEVRGLIYIRSKAGDSFIAPMITLRLPTMFSIKKDTKTNSSPFSTKAQTKGDNGASLSIISPDVTITGDIVSLGDVQIEGAINGNLRAQSCCRRSFGARLC